MTAIRAAAWAVCVSIAGLAIGCGDRSPAEPPAGGPPAVAVTPKATAAIRQYVADAPPGTVYRLRVRVVAGGCQGFMHKLDLDAETSGEGMSSFNREAFPSSCSRTRRTCFGDRPSIM